MTPPPDSPTTQPAAPAAPGTARVDAKANALLIRHTRVNATGICYGWHDVPLASTWCDELPAVRANLPWVPAEVWTSPAHRCRALADSLGCGKVRIDPRLRELHMGEWEGRRWDDFHSAESDAWARDPWHRHPPGGESGEEFWARVGQVRREVLAAGRKRLALVTHGGVIRVWRGIAENRPFDEIMREPVGFGSIWAAV